MFIIKEGLKKTVCGFEENQIHT